MAFSPVAVSYNYHQISCRNEGEPTTWATRLSLHNEPPTSWIWNQEPIIGADVADPKPNHFVMGLTPERTFRLSR